MASRLNLQSKLEELLGSRNVYYQAPPPTGMSYPAIKYSVDDIASTYANNTPYTQKRRYEITVIDRLPDNEVIDKLLALPTCRFNRHYTADNLNHDVLTLYF